MMATTMTPPATAAILKTTKMATTKTSTTRADALPHRVVCVSLTAQTAALPLASFTAPPMADLLSPTDTPVGTLPPFEVAKAFAFSCCPCTNGEAHRENLSTADGRGQEDIPRATAGSEGWRKAWPHCGDYCRKKVQGAGLVPRQSARQAHGATACIFRATEKGDGTCGHGN